MAETRTELTPLAKMLLGSIVAIVILIGVAIGGSALFGGNKNQQLVILKAETEPHKVAPAEKGGLKINSIDSPVLSLLDKAEELEEGVEVLRPPVSEPEPPPIEVTEDVEPEETADPAAAPENTETAATETEAASEQKAEITVIEPAEVVNITPKAEDVPEEDKAEEDKAEEDKAEEKKKMKLLKPSAVSLRHGRIRQRLLRQQMSILHHMWFSLQPLKMKLAPRTQPQCFQLSINHG